MERNCDKCIHHTSGMCSSWDCKMQTVEDVKKEAREKAIEEFAEALKQRCDILYESAGMNYIVRSDIVDIAVKLKGE